MYNTIEDVKGSLVKFRNSLEYNLEEQKLLDEEQSIYDEGLIAGYNTAIELIETLTDRQKELAKMKTMKINYQITEKVEKEILVPAEMQRIQSKVEEIGFQNLTNNEKDLAYEFWNQLDSQLYKSHKSYVEASLNAFGVEK